VEKISKDIFTRLRKSSFVKNLFIVMSGTVAAQVIGLALTPIISRLFSPSDFGISGSFGSLWGVIAAGVTLDYSQAVMLPKEKGDAANLFFVSCLSTLLVSFILMTICLIIPTYLNSLMKTTGIWALVLLVAAAMASGLNSSCSAWCVRVKAFKQTSLSQVIRSLSYSGAQIGFGMFQGGAVGLIISNVLASILASINLARVLLSDMAAIRRNISWVRMKQMAKEYRDFPMYSASQNVINALSSGLPVLLLTQYHGIAVAGAYTFSMRILEAPMGLILSPLRQVLFQKAAEIQHQEQSLASLYIKITAGLFTMAIFPSLVLYIGAPQIFTWVFGAQWHIAGDFARGLIVWLLFVFCNLPAVLFARLIRIQRAIFFYDLVLLAARTTALVLGGLYLSALNTVMLFSFVGAFMNLFLILFVGYFVKKKEVQVNLALMRNSLMKE